MPSLVAKVRPFFGAVVLTALMLIAAGVCSASRMPSGVYPGGDLPAIDRRRPRSPTSTCPRWTSR